MKKIKIVGCGPGSPDYITPAAQAACAGADVLIGARRMLDMFTDVEAERVPVTADTAATLAAIESRCEMANVVALVTGDPGVFSLSASVIKKFGRGACEVIPGISSVQLAFAKLGLDWADARIISAHHSRPEDDFSGTDAPDKVAILSGKKESRGWIADMIDTFQEGRVIFACENLGLENERIGRVDLAALREGDFPSRTIIIAVKEELIT